MYFTVTEKVVLFYRLNEIISPRFSIAKLLFTLHYQFFSVLVALLEHNSLVHVKLEIVAVHIAKVHMEIVLNVELAAVCQGQLLTIQGVIVLFLPINLPNLLVDLELLIAIKVEVLGLFMHHLVVRLLHVELKNQRQIIATHEKYLIH